jgi:tetratricopeptide (TPR) repeat protein
MARLQNLDWSLRVRIRGAYARLAVSVLVSTLVAACGGDPETRKRDYLASADAYMANEQYAEAIIEYRNAIQQDNRFGEARYKLAQAYIKVNDGSRALDEAVRAADLLPEDVDAQIQAANLLILAQRFADAQDRAKAILARRPDEVRATVALGNALAGLKDLNGAVEQLEEAIRLDPTRAGSYTNLAGLQLTAGRHKEAEAAYREGVSKAPDSVPTRLALAQFYWLTSKRDEAEKEIQVALQAEPRNVLANRFAAAFYQTGGDSAKAEQYFRAAVEADGSSRARLALADYYIAAERAPDATTVLQALVSDKAVGLTARVRLANIDYGSGRVEAATAAIDAILTDQPRNIEALLLKASMLFDRKQFDEALARANEATIADPLSAQAHFAKGLVLAAQNRREQAKEAFNSVLKVNPRAASAQIELSKLYLQTGATANAMAYADAAVTSDPRRADARLVLGSHRPSRSSSS